MGKLLCILILFSSVTVHAECQLKVRVVRDYQPQYYQDAQGRWQGMSVELAKVLLQEAGCTPVFLDRPWKRALVQMRDGDLDLILNVSLTEERKNFMYFIGPQRDETVVLVVKKESNWEISSLDDFKALPKGIGIVRGSYWGKEFDEKYRYDPEFAKTIVPVNSAEQLMKMLQNNRILGMIADRYDAVYKIKTREDFNGMKIHPFVINQDWVYFALSKKSVSEEFLDKLRSAYDRARRQGKFEMVLRQYQ